MEREHHHHVDVHIHADSDPRLERMLELLKAIKAGQGKQMAALDDLSAEVAENTTVSQSAVTLLNGLKAALDELIAAGNNDPALAALAAQLGSDTDTLAAAVAANTPAAEPTP